MSKNRHIVYMETTDTQKRDEKNMSKIFTTNWYLQKSYFSTPIINQDLKTSPPSKKQ